MSCGITRPHVLPLHKPFFPMVHRGKACLLFTKRKWDAPQGEFEARLLQNRIFPYQQEISGAEIQWNAAVYPEFPYS